MSAIAGCAQAGAHADVKVMLQRLAHRAPTGTLVRETAEATLGVGWTPTQESAEQTLQQEQTAMDAGGPGRVALAAVTADGVRLTRDRAGVAPLYYGYAAGGVLYFASEVKALLPLTRNIECLPPGYSLVDGQLRRYVPPIVRARSTVLHAPWPRNSTCGSRRPSGRVLTAKRWLLGCRAGSILV